MSNYFTEETDYYLIKFLEEDDVKIKNYIFDKYIRPPFEKLVENQIYVYNFFNIDDVDSLKNDCLTNLFEQIPKYKLSKISEVGKSKRTGSARVCIF